ncbi:putative n-sulfoglucosamine sulfohydrolase protein [Phaeoacremonium minimum UCRPA7]|uniref:Putative n-sulfoglucosamine sulfohydrolase protein n=1 Tax=Phaeoacremonium minimum (strain UCR-PA7) TaxID=1286976 RepID=R8BVN8_PHAM7|nr:putative n-sulfoglucosamine sulfohydrolase protein [Phaeoacremonium minimum UCRPA7]EOO03380.1 putative n-sulfoglucosamine sulfohydrolase protein [Phaeoacremonium minimum UCRPA7]
MASKEHRNVLLMVADDLGLMLGCYGLKAIKTPHADQLAADGTKFINAFASTASCSGSRSTIYTGLHTHQNGQYGLQQGWCHFQTHDHIETTPQIFNSLGYQTGIIGKVHVGPAAVYPWEWFAPSLSRDVRENAAEAGRFFDKAAETGRPFHLTVGLRDPHRDETREGFGNDEDDVKDIQVPDYKSENVEIPPFITDVPELRTELVEYYKSVSRMDLGIGLILKELKKRGLDQNTLVIFVSDNGAPFLNSKTTLYDAGVRLPLIVRQPGGKTGVVNPNMISFLDILPTCIEWAGYKDSDIKTANSEKSPVRPGTPFLRILQEGEIASSEKWTQHVFGSHTFHEVQNYWPTRFMRDHKYKYHRNIAWRLDFPFASDLYSSLSWEGIRNSEPVSNEQSDTPEIMIGRRRLQSYIFRGPEELFDLENDPEEIDNLARNPEFETVLKEMRSKLEDMQYQTDDPWLFRDGVSVMTTQAAQKVGMRLPDRFDFDPTKPGNAAGPYWAPQSAKKSGRGLIEFG